MPEPLALISIAPPARPETLSVTATATSVGSLGDRRLEAELRRLGVIAQRDRDGGGVLGLVAGGVAAPERHGPFAGRRHLRRRSARCPRPACSPRVQLPPPPGRACSSAAAIGARSASGGLTHATAKSLRVAPRLTAFHATSTRPGGVLSIRAVTPASRRCCRRCPGPARRATVCPLGSASCSTLICAGAVRARDAVGVCALGSGERARALAGSRRIARRERVRHAHADVVTGVVVERLGPAHPLAARERRVAEDRGGRREHVGDADLGLVRAHVVRAARGAGLACRGRRCRSRAARCASRP